MILWQGLCDVNGKSAIEYRHWVILPLTTPDDSYSDNNILTEDGFEGKTLTGLIFLTPMSGKINILLLKTSGGIPCEQEFVFPYWCWR
jgi:hypothetical protein